MPSDVNAILQKLDGVVATGDHKLIETHFKTLLKEYEDADKTGSLEYVTVLNELAGWYRGVSRFEESEATFAQLLRAIECTAGKTSIAYARALLNRAGLYRLMGNFERSLACNFEAQEIVDAAANESNESDEYVRATVLNSLTLTYQAKGDLTQAQLYATQSLEFARQSFATGPHEVATALNNLASIHIKKGELDAAETLLSEALALYETMESVNIHLAAVLSSLGAVWYRKANYKQAAEAFERACELTEGFFGKNIEFATGKHNLAMALEALGDKGAAQKQQRLAVEVFASILDAQHPRLQENRRYLAKLEQTN